MDFFSVQSSQFSYSVLFLFSGLFGVTLKVDLKPVKGVGSSVSHNSTADEHI